MNTSFTKKKNKVKVNGKSEQKDNLTTSFYPNCKISFYNGWKTLPSHSFIIEIIDFQIEIIKDDFWLYFTLLNFDIIIELKIRG